MKNSNFNIVVKNLLKSNNKLISIEKIKNIIQNTMDDDYGENKAYKIIYQLKNRGYLINLKKSIFLVKSPEKEYDEGALLELFYWNILKKHCKDFSNGKRYIGGIKALELNLTNFETPEEILIVNDQKQSNETVMFEKQIVFKTYKSGEKNLFSFFNKFTKKIYIGKNIFPIANLELAILESLYNPSIINKTYIEETIKKTIRKQKKNINLKTMEDIIKNNKHHTSINRLYQLALSISPDLSESIKNIIKKYSYFIN